MAVENRALKSYPAAGNQKETHYKEKNARFNVNVKITTKSNI